jgi:hypothetical protein
MAAQPRPLPEARENMYCSYLPHVNVLELAQMCICDDICRQIAHDQTLIERELYGNEESKDAPPLKMQMREATSLPTQSVRLASPNAIYVRSLLHTNRKDVPVCQLSVKMAFDQCPPIGTSAVVVLEKLEDVLGP